MELAFYETKTKEFQCSFRAHETYEQTKRSHCLAYGDLNLDTNIEVLGTPKEGSKWDYWVSLSGRLVYREGIWVPFFNLWFEA
jgi:hypothetical protein